MKRKRQNDVCHQKSWITTKEEIPKSSSVLTEWEIKES